MCFYWAQSVPTKYQIIKLLLNENRNRIFDFEVEMLLYDSTLSLKMYMVTDVHVLLR